MITPLLAIKALRPCRFCRKHPTLEENEDYSKKPLFRYKCCSDHPDRYFFTELVARKFWNDR